MNTQLQQKRQYNFLLRKYFKYIRKRKALIAENRNKHRQEVLKKHIERLYEKLSNLKYLIHKKAILASIAFGALTFLPEISSGQSFGAPQINPFGLSSVPYSYSNPAFVDLDNDGDYDMLSGEYYGSFYYYENTGTPSSPSFAPPQTNPFGLSGVGSYYSAPGIVDIDNDGDFDMFSGSLYGDVLYYENAGTNIAPSFNAPITNAFNLVNIGSSTASHPSFADLDGDGDFDMIIGDDGTNRLIYFENTGSATLPNFGPPQYNPFSLNPTNSWLNPTFFDIDGDADFDLFVGDGSGDVKYFENTGTVNAPSFGPQQTNPFGLSYTNSYPAYDFIDLDNDGDIDMLAGASDADFYYFPGCIPTTDSISINSVCNYISPSGENWKTSGVYKDTIQNSSGCDSIITINLTIDTVSNYTLSANPSVICGTSGSSTINLSGSQSGVDYYLRLNTNDSIIDGPVSGNGSQISFNTNTITTSTTYNVYAEKLIPSNGVRFNKYSNDKINCGNDTSVQLNGNQITLEAWINPSSWVGINQGHIINKEDNGGLGADYGYMIRVGSGGDVSFNLGNGNWNELVTTSTPLSLNQWQHVAATYDGSFMRIYVNGNLIDSMAANNINFSSVNKNLTIGGWAGGPGSVFDGLIDEVRVWSITRTINEIQADMNKCLTGTETGIVGYYQFEEGTGTTTADLTGNGNNGTLTSTTAWDQGYTVCADCNAEMSQTITIDLGQASNASINETACNSYVSPSGNYTWTNSGTYMDTIMNAVGCDSIMTINLTIDTVNTSTSTNGNTISANLANATYQWLDCDNGYSVISGETGQSFTATANGNYAVSITFNNCTDTSNCVNITGIGFEEFEAFNQIMVYPNPTNNQLNVDLGEVKNVSIQLSSIEGKLISTFNNVNKNVFIIDMNTLENGVYFLKIENKDSYKVIKVLKN